MKPRKARWGLALAIVAGLAVAVTSFTRPGAGHEGADEKVAPAALPLNPVELLISLGLKDTEQVAWKGKIEVSEGKVLGLEIVHASRDSTADKQEFTVRAARPKGKKNKPVQAGKLVPAQLRVDLDAPLTAKVSIDTSRGKFSLVLGDVLAGETEKFLDGAAEVKRQVSAYRLTGRGTEDDFPAIAPGRNGESWLVYVEYTPGQAILQDRLLAGNFAALEPKGNGDQIRLMRCDGAKFHPPVDVTGKGLDVWRPTVAVDGQGNVVIAWAQKVDGDWEVFSRRYTPPRAAAKEAWSEIVRVTKTPGSDFHTVAATDSAGKVWLAWQGYRNGNYDILLASAAADGSWSEPKTISSGQANDWSPAIAADGKGSVYVAWDTYDKNNYDVRLYQTGRETKTIAIAESPRFEARPSLVCDKAGRVWIAYEEGDEQWGKDYSSTNEFQKVGFKNNAGYALYINRTVRVKCLEDGKLKQPKDDLEEALTARLKRNRSVPRLAFDAAGGLWLLLRHHPLASGAGEVWQSFALRYDGREWSTPQGLSQSANLLDNRPALAAGGGGLMAVYSTDDRTKTMDRHQDDLVSTVLKSADEVSEPELVADSPAPQAEVPTVHPNEPEDVARLRSYRVSLGGKDLQLLRGEFHRHTEYSAHRDGDGLLEDAWRYALDAGRLDWMGDGDHDNGYGHEFMWWTIQKQSDLHHNPATFIAAMTYERSVVYPNGHRNVMMPRRGIRPLPRGELKGTSEGGTPDTKMLYAYLRNFGGICASHTSGTNMGTDWRDNDPEVEPIVEIYQGHRHNYEHFGAPRSATAQTQIGGYQPAGFVWNALEKGYVLGFQSSSDHISTHLSYAVVLAEDRSREGLIAGFKKRHCYAATDNILLVVRSGEHLMGDSFTTREKPTLTIEAHGTVPIARFHIVRDNKYMYTAEPNEREVNRTWTDMDARPGKTSYYYVRIDQSDSNLAWASPMWITYMP